MSSAETAEAGAERPPVPFVVIGGYLGAGKTTLLNRVLRNNAGLRAAVLVNDFGAVNIDADLVTASDGETITFANGCVCCSLASGMVQTIWRLQEMDPAPDVVIVEASGVANPNRVASYGWYPGFAMQGIVILVDAETVREKAADSYVGDSVLRQLRAADLLVLNKTDLVSPEQADAVDAWLRETVPGARVVRSAGPGEVPFAVLVDAPRSGPPPADDEPHAAHETLSLVSDAPVDRAALEAFAAGLPDGVVRAKGIVRLAESPEREHVFQMVGRRRELDEREPGDDPTSRLVLIGLPGSIDREAVPAALPGFRVVEE